MNTLKDAKVGKTYKVVKLHGQGAIKRRIMDMGITKGVEIYVRLCNKILRYDEQSVSQRRN